MSNIATTGKKKTKEEKFERDLVFLWSTVSPSTFTNFGGSLTRGCNWSRRHEGVPGEVSP